MLASQPGSYEFGGAVEGPGAGGPYKDAGGSAGAMVIIGIGIPGKNILVYVFGKNNFNSNFYSFTFVVVFKKPNNRGATYTYGGSKVAIGVPNSTFYKRYVY